MLLTKWTTGFGALVPSPEPENQIVQGFESTSSIALFHPYLHGRYRYLMKAFCSGVNGISNCSTNKSCSFVIGISSIRMGAWTRRFRPEPCSATTAASHFFGWCQHFLQFQLTAWPFNRLPISLRHLFLTGHGRWSKTTNPSCHVLVQPPDFTLARLVFQFEKCFYASSSHGEGDSALTTDHLRTLSARMRQYCKMSRFRAQCGTTVYTKFLAKTIASNRLLEKRLY